MASRNIRIDTLRGIACIFLVAYHVIGHDGSSGLKINTGFLRDLNDYLAYIRMPLFSFLSGFVYAYRPVREYFREFLFKKARRLLIPLLVVGTTFALLQSIVPGTNNKLEHWYLLHIIPYAHFWFLESLFLIFCFLAVLERFNVFAKQKYAVSILGVSCLLHISSIEIIWFGVFGFFYLLPYFLFGMFMLRFEWLERTPRYWAVILLGAVVCFFIIFGMLSSPEDNRSISALIIGASMCCILLVSRLENRLLAHIGVYSYAIYLFHVFFTAASRMVLENFVVIEDTYLLFAVGLTIGVSGPILFHLLFEKNKYTGLLFLGRNINRC